MLPGERLCLSEEPLQSFLAALALQLLPNHVPAGLVVAVEPVTLQGKKEGHRTVTGKLPRPAARGPGATVTTERREARMVSFAPGSPVSASLGKSPSSSILGSDSTIKAS